MLSHAASIHLAAHRCLRMHAHRHRLDAVTPRPSAPTPRLGMTGASYQPLADADMTEEQTQAELEQIRTEIQNRTRFIQAPQPDHREQRLVGGGAMWAGSACIEFECVRCLARSSEV